MLSLRVKGVYLAMVTLAFAEMFFILAEAGDFRQYTGADDGLHGFPVPAYLSAADYRTRFYYLALVFFVVVFLAARRLVNSPTGRVMIATPSGSWARFGRGPSSGGPAGGGGCGCWV